MEERGHAVGGVGGAQDPRGLDRSQVVTESRDRRWDAIAWDPHHLGGHHLLLVEALSSFVVERAHGPGLEEQRALDEARVHIEQEVGIEGVVLEPGHPVHALDPLVDGVDPVGGRSRLRLGTERDRVGEQERALQPPPRIAFVEAGLASTGDHERMRRLHEHSSGAAEENRDLAMDLPRDRAGPEEAEVAHGAAMLAPRAGHRRFQTGQSAPPDHDEGMRLLVPIIVLAILLGYLIGGRLRRLEAMDLQWWPLVLIGLGIQFVPLPEGDTGNDLLIRTGVLAISYSLLVLFALVNVRMPGMPLVLLGLACNAVVIVANGGMPVSEEALRDSEQEDVIQFLVEEGADKHHLLEDRDVLTFLADVIPVPPPIRQAISIGDVFVYLGLIWLVAATMRARTPSERASPGRRRGKHRPGAAGYELARPSRWGSPPAATRSGTAR